MTKQILISLIAAGVALASGKTYRVNLVEPSLLGNIELKPGEYRLEVVDQKAVIRVGNTKKEAPVKVEAVESKYDTTTVRYNKGEGKSRIQEIRIGGTKTKLVFTE